MHASPRQTESQVDPSFQLASTCDSVWPELKHNQYFLVKELLPLHGAGKALFGLRNMILVDFDPYLCHYMVYIYKKTT